MPWDALGLQAMASLVIAGILYSEEACAFKQTLTGESTRTLT